MKKVYLGFFLLLAVAIINTSCASKKQGQWLSQHAQLLEQAANTDMPHEQKMDVLAQSYVDMMNQSLKFTNPKKGVAFAKMYSKQNQANINKIFKDLEGWKMKMNTVESIAFGVKMLNKPYTRGLVGLFSKFRRKYQMYKAVYDLSGAVKGGLMGLAGKSLGL